MLPDPEGLKSWDQAAATFASLSACVCPERLTKRLAYAAGGVHPFPGTVEPPDELDPLDELEVPDEVDPLAELEVPDALDDVEDELAWPDDELEVDVPEVVDDVAVLDDVLVAPNKPVLAEWVVDTPEPAPPPVVTDADEDED